MAVCVQFILQLTVSQLKYETWTTLETLFQNGTAVDLEISNIFQKMTWVVGNCLVDYGTLLKWFACHHLRFSVSCYKRMPVFVTLTYRELEGDPWEPAENEVTQKPLHPLYLSTSALFDCSIKAMFTVNVVFLSRTLHNCRPM